MEPLRASQQELLVGHVHFLTVGSKNMIPALEEDLLMLTISTAPRGNILADREQFCFFKNIAPCFKKKPSNNPVSN